MTGDRQDIAERLRRFLPASWFPTDAVDRPILGAVLEALATGSEQVHSLLTGVRDQLRISTATGLYLDLAAADLFGALVPRRTGQSDASYRATLRGTLGRERGTRQSIINVLEELTGRTPQVIELKRHVDTGVYAAAVPAGLTGQPALDHVQSQPSYCAYDVAGAYGSVTQPYQALVQAYRKATTGIPNVAGYADLSSMPTPNITTGQYYHLATPPADAGGSSYSRLSDILDYVYDHELYAAVDAIRPAGTTIWMRIAA